MTWLARYDRLLKSWAGKPGVSCGDFVCRVLDEMHGYRDFPAVDWPAPDAPVHDSRRVTELALRLAQRWPHVALRPQEWAQEPGDVLVLSASGGKGEGHFALTGARANEVWHCGGPAGVCYTGIGLVLPRLVRVWRPTEKSKW